MVRKFTLLFIYGVGPKVVDIVLFRGMCHYSSFLQWKVMSPNVTSLGHLPTFQEFNSDPTIVQKEPTYHYYVGIYVSLVSLFLSMMNFGSKILSLTFF